MRRIIRVLGVGAVAAFTFAAAAMAAPVQLAQAPTGQPPAIDLTAVNNLGLPGGVAGQLTAALQNLAAAQQSGNPTQIATAQAALTLALTTAIQGNPTQAAAIAGAATKAIPGAAATITQAAAGAAPTAAVAIAIAVFTNLPPALQTPANQVLIAVDASQPGNPVTPGALPAPATPIAGPAAPPPAPPPPPITPPPPPPVVSTSPT